MAEGRLFRIGVLLSGRGSNLQALLDAVASGVLQAEVVCVGADRPAYGLQRAAKVGIPTFVATRGPQLSEALNAKLDTDLDLVVLAGFLSILPPDFCRRWRGKLINLHPALLPRYGGKGMYGRRVHRAVIENEEVESGATVHYVTAEVDKGAIIAQRSLRLSQGETPESLEEKVHRIEHPLLVGAIQKIIAERRPTPSP